jgi:mycofactocin precursor
LFVAPSADTVADVVTAVTYVKENVMSEPVEETTTASEVEAPELLEEELLVEDVSIDGMCGVY